MRRAIRAHANFVETVPMGLVLALLLAFQDWPYAGGAVALLLLSGRAFHATGLSRSPENFRFRVSGMMLTLASYALGAVLLGFSLLL